MADEPVEPPLEEEEGGPVKPFLDHLEDLRWVLIKCISAVVIGMAICMYAAPHIVKFLTRPVPKGMTITSFGPLEPVTIAMKVALFGGIALALPFVLYFVGHFVLPALKRTEKKYFLRAITIGAGLFFSGVALCYFAMLPISMWGLIRFNTWLHITTEAWRAGEYFSFVCWFMIAMGLSFELPVLVLTLVKLGILEHSTLVKSRKYVFVINLVASCFITPDFLSTFFVMIPLQLLMEASIQISAYWERQKKREEAALLASEPGHPSLPD
jgi:sec-independent protein translocase protein TatC